MRIARTLTTLAATVAGTAVALSAGPASAASVRQPITDHAPFVAAVCEGGAEVIASVEDGYAIVRETATGFTLNLSYTLGSTLSTTGETVLVTGAVHIVHDLESGTITQSGNDRSYQVAGVGWVLKSAGRSIWPMDDPTAPPLFRVGPDADGYDPAAQCALFGLDPA